MRSCTQQRQLSSFQSRTINIDTHPAPEFFNDMQSSVAQSHLAAGHALPRSAGSLRRDLVIEPKPSRQYYGQLVEVERKSFYLTVSKTAAKAKK
jgi:hypothetical protein